MEACTGRAEREKRKIGQESAQYVGSAYERIQYVDAGGNSISIYSRWVVCVVVQQVCEVGDDKRTKIGGGI